MIEGLLKVNAKGAEGMSGEGLEANEKLDNPELKVVDPPREKAEGAKVKPVVGTENMNADEDDTGGAVTVLNGAVEEEAALARGVIAAAEERLRFGNFAGPGGMEAAVLGS